MNILETARIAREDKLNAMRDQLEAMIDASELGRVLQLLSEIAGAKAMAIGESGTRAPEAMSWDRDADLIERCAGRVEN